MSAFREFVLSLGGIAYAAALLVAVGVVGCLAYVALSYPPARQLSAIGFGILVVGLGLWWAQKNRRIG